MKYVGEFDSINSVPYRIEIETLNGSGTKTLKLSGNPFTSSVESDSESLIYSPIRCGGATVGILTESYVEDFYSGKAKGVKVKLLNENENKVEWIGYVTPTCYSQGFDNTYEELQLDCVDGIAVLKNIQYRAEDKDVRTFAYIIHKCLSSAECFRNFYISDNVQLTVNGTESVIDIFRVSENNFFNERKSADQLDDDLAWHCYDVLYQLCQFLGYTIVVEGDEVFIIDYDAIKKGNNSYFKYSLDSDSVGTPVRTTVGYSKHIDGVDYAENGTSIELSKIYNKVIVKDEFNKFDSILDTFGDINFENNITVKEDEEFDINCGKSGAGVHYNILYEGDTFEKYDSKGNNNSYQIFTIKGETPWDKYIWVIVNKFYDSPLFDFKRYNSVTYNKMFEDISDNENYSNRWPAFNYANGAWYVRQWKKKLERDEYNRWRANYPADWHSMTKERREKAWVDLLNTPPEGLNLTPMIVMVNAGPGTQSNRYHIGPAGQRLGDGSNGKTDNEDCRHYPYIRLKDGNTAGKIFGGEGSYLVIQGTFIQHDKELYPFPMSEGSENKGLSEKKRYKVNDQFFNWARLQWGDHYWDGNKWVTTPTDFKLWFLQNHNEDWTNLQDMFDKSFDVIDTTKLNQVVGEPGYYVPTPPNGNLNGKVDFILYCQRDFYGSRKKNWFRSRDWRYDKYYNRIQILKNFKLKAFVSGNDTLGVEDMDSDTVYTNIIDETNVETLDEIGFKVCTYDDKNVSYSSVDYMNNGNSEFVRTTFNKALYSEQNGTQGYDGLNASLRQEEHYVFKMATQYSDPRTIFECNLKNQGHKLYGKFTDKTIAGKDFVMTDKEVDYKFNKVRIRLIEKA